MSSTLAVHQEHPKEKGGGSQIAGLPPLPRNLVSMVPERRNGQELADRRATKTGGAGDGSGPMIQYLCPFL